MVSQKEKENQINKHWVRRDRLKKAKRDETSETAITSVLQQDSRQIMLTPRELLKQEIKNRKE